VTQKSAEPREEKTAASMSLLTDAQAVPLPRVNERPELVPRSPAGQQAEDLFTFDKKHDQ